MEPSSSFSSEKSDLYKIHFYNKKSPSYFHWILFVINEKLLPSFFLLCLLIKTCYRKTIKRICARKIEFFTPDPIIFSYMNVNMNKCLKASPNWKTTNTIFQAWIQSWLFILFIKTCKEVKYLKFIIAFKKENW